MRLPLFCSGALFNRTTKLNFGLRKLLLLERFVTVLVRREMKPLVVGDCVKGVGFCSYTISVLYKQDVTVVLLIDGQILTSIMKVW